MEYCGGTFGSKEIVKAAIMMALTSDRDEERALKDQLANKGIKTAAVGMAVSYQLCYENH